MGVLPGFAAHFAVSLTKSNISATRIGVRPATVRPLRPSSTIPSVRRLSNAPVMRYSGGGGGSRGVPPAERILSIAPYLLPLLDALSFGRFVFAAAPAVAAPMLWVLGPIYGLYRGIPFVAFGIFLALYVLVVRNNNVSRFVRFNTFQALMIDIALIVPQLLASFNIGGSIPVHIVELLCSTVFYAVLLAVGYAVAANVRGQLPDKIPAVSESVYAQLGM